jgi:CheY-like chemotaxis protein
MRLKKKIFIVIGVTILVTILNYLVLLLSFNYFFSNRDFHKNNLSVLNVMVPIVFVYIIVLIITIIMFVQYDKKNEIAFAKYKALKRQTIHANRINERFFDVVSKGKRMAFRFNLSKDLILDDDIVDNKNGKSVIKYFSLPNKCSFSEFLNKINSYIIVDDKHIKKLTYDEIVKYYMENDETYYFKVKSQDTDNKEVITSNEVIFYKEENGDVLGIFISDDITSDNQRLIKQVNYVQNMDKSIATVLSYTYIRVVKLYIDFNSATIIHDVSNKKQDPYELLDYKTLQEVEFNNIPYPYNKTIRNFLSIDNIKNNFDNNKFIISSNYMYKDYYHRIGIIYSYEEDKKVAHILIKDVSREIEDSVRQKQLNVKLDESMKRESQYLETLLSRSCLHFDINLTKNIITSHSKFILEDKEIHYFDEIDKKETLFDEYVALSREKVNPKYLEKFDSLMNVNKLINAYSNGINSIEDEILFNFSDNSKLFIRYTILLNKNFDTNEIECLIICYDITKNRLFLDNQKEILASALFKARESSNVKSKFLSNMSHDIKTPLNAIIGMNQIAKDNIDNKQVVLDALEKMDVSSKHLLNMVNDVLSLSRYEANKMTLNEENISLKKSIELLNQLAIGQNSIKKLNLTFNDKTKYQGEVSIDNTKLNNALMNIINNAIKYTPIGGNINIEIDESESKLDGYIHIDYIISDNGVGMSEEFIKRLFIPFERETEKVSGTGIGLSISKAIIDLMKGNILVTSKVGVGTTFTISVDLKKVISDSNNDNEEYDITGMKILVVDDNLMNQEVISKNLHALGASCINLSDGNEFINYIKNNPDSDIDLVLCDIKMPNCDGWQATKSVRMLDSKLAHNIPIIGLSANAYQEDITHSIEVGMNGYVTKPVIKEDLLKEIKRVHGGRK